MVVMTGEGKCCPVFPSAGLSFVRNKQTEVIQCCLTFCKDHMRSSSSVFENRSLPECL